MPATQVAMPITMIASGIDTSATSTAQARASQKVRICQVKCDSSQVPRASPRFT